MRYQRGTFLETWYEAPLSRHPKSGLLIEFSGTEVPHDEANMLTVLNKGHCWSDGEAQLGFR